MTGDEVLRIAYEVISGGNVQTLQTVAPAPINRDNVEKRIYDFEQIIDSLHSECGTRKGFVALDIIA